MNVIYGFPFIYSYDYADGEDKSRDRYKTNKRLPVEYNGEIVGNAFPRWNRGATRLLLDIVFHETPDEKLLRLAPEKIVDVCRIPSRIVGINLIAPQTEIDMYGYTKTLHTLFDYVSLYPEVCTCGAPYTSHPLIHLASVCDIKPGAELC